MSHYRSSDYINDDNRVLANIGRAVLIILALIIAVKIGVFLLATLFAITISGLVLAVLLAPFLVAGWLLWLLLRALLG